MIPKQRFPKAWVIITMNIFDSLNIYGGKWAVVADKTRGFSDEERSLINRAEVVSSDYGKSVCFFMVGGGQTYIPLSTNSTLGVGDSVDVSKAKILTLHRDGSADITRIEI